MKIKKILFANPGNFCSKSKTLTEKGKLQVVSVLEDLTPEIAIDKTLIVTSTTRHAFETAMIIGDSLSLPIEQTESLKLASSDSYVRKAKNILEIASKYDCTTLIIVAHDDDRYVLAHAIMGLVYVNPGFIPFGFGIKSNEASVAVYNSSPYGCRIIEPAQMAA